MGAMTKAMSHRSMGAMSSQPRRPGRRVPETSGAPGAACIVRGAEGRYFFFAPLMSVTSLSMFWAALPMSLKVSSLGSPGG